MAAKIQVLVGMIASGKSTYCQNAARNGVVCVNDDAIVNLIHGGNYGLYDKKLKGLYKQVENVILHDGLLLGRTAIVDRGLNVSVNGRRRWTALANSLDVPCEAVVFDKRPAAVHASRRFQVEPRGHSEGYWLKVAEHHESVYEFPSLSEGFSVIQTVPWEIVRAGEWVE